MELAVSLEWVLEDPLAELNRLKLTLISDGAEVIDLSMINPDLPPGRFLQDKLLEAAVRPENHRYAVSRGIKKLRAAFAVKYQQTFGVTLDPETEVCATLGSKDAITHLLHCIAPSRKAVLVGQPTYPAYLYALRTAGVSFGFFSISDDESAMLQEIEQELASGRYGLLLLNFPNNPSGTVVDRCFYNRLAQIAERYHVCVANDFVYGEMLFDEPAGCSLLGTEYFRREGVEIYSLSKAYNIPGWRVGAVLGSVRLVNLIVRLKSRLDYGIFLPLQTAAAAALSSHDNLVGAVRRQYRERSLALIKGLRTLGFELAAPSAGCSLWARLPLAYRSLGAEEFCRRLLQEERIVLLPGGIFGEGFKDYVRLALVSPVERLAVVFERLRSFQERTRL